jgi:hypothetical protein
MMGNTFPPIAMKRDGWKKIARSNKQIGILVFREKENCYGTVFTQGDEQIAQGKGLKNKIDFVGVSSHHMIDPYVLRETASNVEESL